MDQLEAISPIDGRYRRSTEPLADIFSEKGLIKYRVKVEGEYLLSLSEHPEIGTRDFSSEEKDLIRRLSDISTEDAGMVKAIEVKGYGDIKATNHDVKAVEYFMKEKLKGTSLEDSLEWIHFALTSEDVNNLAYGLMLSDGVGEVVLPTAQELYKTIEGLARQHRDIPMLARTHGQPASPTTFGKEFRVFASRLKRQLDQLANYEILVKLNGATGNYNAHHAAYPEIDWTAFTIDFVERFNGGRRIRLKPNLVTTQVEPHDTYAELCDNLRRLNTILIDFDQDLWRYISDDWIKQKPVEGEVGSSTMPHKINPIDFENSEGNLGLANALFGYFSSKLPVSRLQRDLSDSTIERNFGVALGHSLIGYKSARKGLSKIAVNEQKVVEELENHPEVISEAIQTVLRREGAEMPYERLKELTRGRKPTRDDFRTFIDGLDVSDEVKEELRQITPTNYTGIARLLVDKCTL
ncbi:MAG: adenylosuccinate lyase [Nanoarchaeota archaeon]|nr:adenylosuccinate lyase [Nanoarchaeota archaeon]MBU1977417.1 adenylosuccinate lyase [Nanoarchaeota archaeon]